mgnify:FL=1
MSNVKLVWATTDAERFIAYMARVSNPRASWNDEKGCLLKYLIKNQHWSPFEMANVCLEIDTTRDVARQILRHRSFSFQEFSQRYAVADGYELSEARMQDTKNRQNSIPTEDRELKDYWRELQQKTINAAREAYEQALRMGIAKEVARKVLPEGLTTSKMYMNGTVRSWLHYIAMRCDVATQKEHRDVADQCRHILRGLMPTLFGGI